MKELREKQTKAYNDLIYYSDVITGLIPAPHTSYPFTYTNLLNMAESALIYCSESYERKKAESIRALAIRRIQDGVKNDCIYEGIKFSN